MFESNILTVVVVLILAAVLAYRVSYLRDKTLGYFSLLQVLYLVVIPGVMFPLVFGYIRSITARPLNAVRVFPDGFLLNVTYLAILFAYAGVVIHSVTKMIEEAMTEAIDSKAVKMTRFFHYTLSHNLVFGGGALMLLGISLLELNHTPIFTSSSIGSLIVRGILLGGGTAMAVYFYRPYATSRWSDLRSFFLVVWLGFMAVLYGIKKVDPRVRDYQLLIPAVVSFAVMTFLSLVMVARRVGRRYRVYVSRKRLKKMMTLAEEEWS